MEEEEEEEEQDEEDKDEEEEEEDCLSSKKGNYWKYLGASKLSPCVVWELAKLLTLPLDKCKSLPLHPHP